MGGEVGGEVGDQVGDQVGDEVEKNYTCTPTKMNSEFECVTYHHYQPTCGFSSLTISAAAAS